MTLSLIVQTAAAQCATSWQCRAHLCIRIFLHFMWRSRVRANVCAWICLRQQFRPSTSKTSLLGRYPE